MSDETYLTPQQVAELLQVNPRTIYRWIADGKLAARRLPGRGRHGVLYRISQADLARLLAGKEQGGNEHA